MLQKTMMILQIQKVQKKRRESSFLNSNEKNRQKKEPALFMKKKTLFSSKIDDKLITTFGNPDISSRRGVLL